MARTKKQVPATPLKRIRKRPGSIMADIGEERRAKLQAILDDRTREYREANRSEIVTVTSTVNYLIDEEFRRRGLALPRR